jgi:hypothetical protein
MEATPETINWLMEGDPVIRWQAMRDLLDLPECEWQAEREKTLHSGWGAQFLERLQEDGAWPQGRWTGTVWTLLTAMDCGLPPDNPRLSNAANYFIDRVLTGESFDEPDWLRKHSEICHTGFWLRIGAYFKVADDRLPHAANGLLQVRMQDGAWNCRIRQKPKTHHSSFHTTFNVLEGLREAAIAGIIADSIFRTAEAEALEFMLEHKMYRSDKTGEIISDRFLHLTYPSHWHYTVLRGLDYVRCTPAIFDSRLADPIAQLISRQDKNGRWPVEKPIRGTTLFLMEKIARESRWNTLRALRVLKCAGLRQHGHNHKTSRAPSTLQPLRSALGNLTRRRGEMQILRQDEQDWTR